MEIIVPTVSLGAGAVITGCIGWYCRSLERNSQENKIFKENFVKSFKKNKEVSIQISNILRLFLKNSRNINSDKIHSLIINLSYFAGSITVMKELIDKNFSSKKKKVFAKINNHINNISNLFDRYLNIDDRIFKAHGWKSCEYEKVIIQEIEYDKLNFITENNIIKIDFNNLINIFSDFLQKYSGWEGQNNYYLAVLYLIYKEFNQLTIVLTKKNRKCFNSCINADAVHQTILQNSELELWISENELVEPEININITNIFKNLSGSLNSIENIFEPGMLLNTYLVFAESWCPVCLHRLTILLGKSHLLKDKINLVIVTSNDDITKTREIPNEVSVYWPLKDEDKYFNELRKILKITSIPSGVYIDKLGNSILTEPEVVPSDINKILEKDIF